MSLTNSVSPVCAEPGGSVTSPAPHVCSETGGSVTNPAPHECAEPGGSVTNSAPIPYRKTFSVVYAEEAALSHPRAQRILAKLPEAEVIRCRDYREVFNRPHQSPALQKNA